LTNNNKIQLTQNALKKINDEKRDLRIVVEATFDFIVKEEKSENKRMDEHALAQLRGLIKGYDTAFSNLEVLEEALKLHLKDLKGEGK